MIRRDSPLAVAVGTYLLECRKYAHLLRASDHPTVRGMLQVVHCRSAAEKEQAGRLLEHLIRTRR